MVPINKFTGIYRFLSNFWPAKVRLGEREYASVEHAYQAAKSPFNETYLAKILRVPEDKANDAKKLGQDVVLRADWDAVRLDVMLNLVRQKFQEPALKLLLLETGEAELIEGNYWHDTFWGVCDGRGENHLGKILMQVRKEIQREDGNH